MNYSSEPSAFKLSIINNFEDNYANESQDLILCFIHLVLQTLHPIWQSYQNVNSRARRVVE